MTSVFHPVISSPDVSPPKTPYEDILTQDLLVAVDVSLPEVPEENDRLLGV